MHLNIDRVWSRLQKSERFKNRGLHEFMYRGIGQQFAIGASTVGSTTRVDFPAGAIVLGISAGMNVTGQAGTQVIRDLSAIRVSIDYAGSGGGVLTGGRINGAAIFGYDGTAQFPAKELVLGTDSYLNYVIENLTSSAITVDVVHHCLVARGAHS